MNLTVVLVSPRNPLNIGAAARALSNFGFTDLRLVNPYDKAFREAVSAVGGAPVLQAARVFEDVASAVSDCSVVVGTTSVGNRSLQHPIQALASAVPELRAEMRQGKAALLFGSEKFGLSIEDMSFCHSLIRIPTVPETPSMNLGQSVAVCLYELVRVAETPAREPRGRPADGEEIERITQMLLETLDASGYTNRIVATSTEQKIRRFVRRWPLDRRDARLVLGILRQILWKLRH